ncbi:DUF4436 domain-containing protein [Mycobacterium gordonae]|nr:DUF4436 domain-containing protein [Mycobacterium gordonae]OBK47806.1 DUF4436 domain-containing protein [Mycobacterium gordonae]
MKLGIVGVLLFIAAYVASNFVYAGAGHGPHDLTQGQPMPDGTTITMDLQEVQQSNTILLANLTIVPGPGLLDPRTHDLTQDLSVVVTSAASPTKRSWTKGMVPGSFPVPLSIAGAVTDWPFDHYVSGPIAVEVFRGDNPTPERAAVTFADRLAGWRIDISTTGNPAATAPYRIELERSPSTKTFAVVILAVLVALAGMGLFVAVQTARDKRKFQPPMTTWYAAMLFAVVPRRNALPNAPPFGAEVDVRVVLWVIVVLVLSMLIYITCWWRHLAPEQSAKPDKPAKPAEPAATS